MKKLFVLALFGVSMFFVSCDSNKKSCYEITVTMGVAPTTTSSSTFIYATEAEVELEMKKFPVSNIMKASYQKVDKSEADCVGSALDLGDFEM